MEITLSVVRERQKALISGDYSNYHARTTRRIHTIRRRLGVTTPKGRKYAVKAPVTPENVAKDVQWVHLLLASAERAWADAMHMKTSQSPENTQRPIPGSTKTQIISRYRRAISCATSLVQVLQDQSTTGASDHDLLEAKAYLSLLQGGLAFERKKWATCIEQYSFVRLVYTTLSKSSRSDLYQDVLDGTIDPSLRYAAYQEKLPRTKAIADLTVEKFPSDDAESRQIILKADDKAFETTAERVAAQAEGVGYLPTTIEWRGRKVKLEDASISQAVAIASSKEDSLATAFSSFEAGNTSAKDLVAAYDDVINARQDAVDATKTAIDELLAEGVEQADPRIQSLQVTRTAVNYAVIAWRIGRNRVLCGQQDGIDFSPAPLKHTRKPQKDENERPSKDEPTGRKLARLRERVALYDSILQNIDAIKQLPGVMADTDFVTELDNKFAYFRALKCLAVGRSHAVNGQIGNALALFSRAYGLNSKIKSSSQVDSSVPRLDVTNSHLQALDSHLISLTMQYRALTDLKKHTVQQDTQSKRYTAPLIERLHLSQYDDNVDLQNIVNYPPKLQPIPMKPLFFDLAWDYILYPGQDKKAATTSEPSNPSTTSKSTTQPDEAPKKKGWFGFGR